MKALAAAQAAELLRQARVAALATVRDGAPRLAMTPYALLQSPLAFLVLVSGLSAHTKDMLADARVALLVTEREREGANVHALARASIRGEARPLRPDDPRHAAARAAYAARFPAMSELFGLPDFVLFAIQPLQVRVVAGFAQAASVTPGALEAALRRLA